MTNNGTRMSGFPAPGRVEARRLTCGLLHRERRVPPSFPHSPQSQGLGMIRSQDRVFWQVRWHTQLVVCQEFCSASRPQFAPTFTARRRGSHYANAFIARLLLFLLLCVVPAVRGDSFEQFTTTGQFLNDPHVALTGGLIVDKTTGQVVSIDVFHGLTELTLLGITRPDPGVPNDFLIVAHDPAGDSMNLKPVTKPPLVQS